MELLLELFLQIFGELLVNSLAHAFNKERETPGANPVLAGIGYALIGAILGAISLAVIHRPIFSSPLSQALALIATTIAMGLFASALGYWRKRRGRPLLRIDRFAYGALFGFAFGLVRFFAV